MHNVATEKGVFLKAAAFSSANNFGVAQKRGEVGTRKEQNFLSMYSKCILN